MVHTETDLNQITEQAWKQEQIVIRVPGSRHFKSG